MPLLVLQALIVAAVAALVAAAAYLGAAQERRVSGVDCSRVRAGTGHISQWEREACRGTL